MGGGAARGGQGGRRWSVAVAAAASGVGPQLLPPTNADKLSPRSALNKLSRAPLALERGGALPAHAEGMTLSGAGRFLLPHAVSEEPFSGESGP